MKNSLFCIVLSIASAAAFAAPQVTVSGSVSVVDGLATVRYTLTEDAVVTPEFFVGDEKIPDSQVTRLYGDICRKVTADGAEKSFVWAVGSELGDVKGAALSGASLTVRLTAWPVGNPPDYMCADLAATNYIRYYATSSAVPFGIFHDIYKTGKILFRKIPARNVVWMMGSPTSESGRATNELYHAVMLSYDYYMGLFPVTQGQLYVVRGARSAATGTFSTTPESDFYPVNAYSYNGVRGSPSTLSETSFVGTFRTTTGLDIDLPSEAEWEFACRAGTTTTYYYGNSASASMMRYGSSAQHTGVVGMFPPNAFGLYDMHGHVWEFCRDWFGMFEMGKVFTDPKGPDSNDEDRVVAKGGSYASAAQNCRSAKRNNPTRAAQDWDLGFRLMAPAVAK